MADKEPNTKFLKISPLDTEKFIKVNELKKISNPIFFNRSNLPTEDGLLSNDIFGITKDDRTTIFAYINLGGESFLHPLAYKSWLRLDSNIKLCVYETETFVLDKNTGKLKPDPNGETGIKFLKKIIKDIDFKKTKSIKRGIKIDFLEKYRDKLFIENFIVIPAGYRDVDSSSGTKLGVGEVNKLYDSIIRDTNALREAEDYGLSLNGSLRGKIQDKIVEIYDWLVFGRFNGKDSQASGLSRKLGLIRRAGMKKSFDWGSRLVICTQNLRKENLNDLTVDLDSIGLPLAAVCANFFPYMLFQIRTWFENNLSDVSSLLAYDPKTKKSSRVETKDWREEYSDERIKKEIDRFMHGMSNRLYPVILPVEDKNKEYYMYYRGRHVTDEDILEHHKSGDIINNIPNMSIMERPLTWCDLIYQAAVEVCKDKMTLISRFPIDSYFNQFPCKIKVLSTIETEPMIIENKLYKEYPKIRVEDIGSNTSDKFADVALPNNVRLDSIGGDFDGDTISSKATYSIEANQELYDAVNMKKHFISLDASNLMITKKECIQSLYNLTLVLPDSKSQLTKAEF